MQFFINKFDNNKHIEMKNLMLLFRVNLCLFQFKLLLIYFTLVWCSFFVYLCEKIMFEMSKYLC